MGSPRLAKRGRSYKVEPDEGFDDTHASVWFDDWEGDYTDDATPDALRIMENLEGIFYVAWRCELAEEDVNPAVRKVREEGRESDAWDLINAAVLAAGFSTWHSDTRLLIWHPDLAPPESTHA